LRPAIAEAAAFQHDARQEPRGREFPDHYDALLREAAHRLVDTMAQYTVLTRHDLEILPGADEWRSVSFEQALQWAVEHGVLGRLTADLYEIPAKSAAAGSARPS
jgi:hypothetical protein